MNRFLPPLDLGRGYEGRPFHSGLASVFSVRHTPHRAPPSATPCSRTATCSSSIPARWATHPHLATGGGAGPAVAAEPNLLRHQRTEGEGAEKAGRGTVDVEKCWHHLFAEPGVIRVAGGPALPPPAAHLLAGRSWVLTFVASADSTWGGTWPGWRRTRESWASPPGPAPNSPGHLTDFLVQQLTPWPAWQQGVAALLGSVAQCGVAPRRNAAGASETPAEVAGSPGEVVVLHPGSGSPHKCWPAESYLELTERLKGGRRPRAWSSAKWNWNTGRRSSSTRSPPRPTCGGRRRSSNCGTPTPRRVRRQRQRPGPPRRHHRHADPRALRPDRPARWRPLGRTSPCLRREPMAVLGVGEVLDAVTATLGGREDFTNRGD